MNITIKINTDNGAFVGRTRAETARILRDLADALDYGSILNEDTNLPMIDLNGNIVGHLTVKE
jgi:hypothetical protein